MDAELKTKWVEALRGGAYPQCTGFLHRGANYCCLGVLYEISGGKWKRTEKDAYFTKYGFMGYLGPSRDELGLTDGQHRALSEMNDTGMPFAVIADYIEINIPAESQPHP